MSEKLTPNPTILDPAGARAHSPRTVAGIFPNTGFHWVGNGFRVSSYFPRAGLPAERVSPFLLMDYGPPSDFPPLAKGKRGVGWHPHRGFETVTVAWEGVVAHADSLGNSGVIGPGDVQWMTAAKGILHQEYHEDAFAKQGGRMHMMQLWVNLPKAHKMSAPAYQDIRAAAIPTVSLPENGGSLRVIAGSYGEARGPAQTHTPITMLDVNLQANTTFNVDLPASFNALAVVLDGRATAGGKTASAGELFLFENDGKAVQIRADQSSHILILSGEPIEGPIVQHGPFVMNTRAEIHQAILDFNAGLFGRVPADLS